MLNTKYINSKLNFITQCDRGVDSKFDYTPSKHEVLYRLNLNLKKQQHQRHPWCCEVTAAELSGQGSVHLWQLERDKQEEDSGLQIDSLLLFIELLILDIMTLWETTGDYSAASGKTLKTE